MGNALKMGSKLLGKLEKLKRTHALIGDVRGMGLMIGVELVKNKKNKEPFAAAAHEIVQRAFKRGLLMLPCGENVIRFSPPLVIQPSQIDIAVGIFSEILSQYEMECGLA
jgi:4-aminobutyrate aminotransferase